MLLAHYSSEPREPDPRSQLARRLHARLVLKRLAGCRTAKRRCKTERATAVLKNMEPSPAGSGSGPREADNSIASVRTERMQSLASTTPPIRIVALENDPLWFAGLRALLMSEAEVELVAADLAEVPNLRNGDLVLLRSRAGNSLFEVMERVKCERPDVRVLVS